MTECIEWWGSKFTNGYGQGYWGKGMTRVAHRAIYEMVYGFIPDMLEVDHTCENRSCVNPAHLQLVTRSVNAQLRSQRQTHCRRGHEYTPENIIIRPNQTKTCRVCANEGQRKRRKAYE